MDPEFPRIGESRTEEQWRLRPFTGFAVVLFALTITAGLVATIVFADTSDERRTYGLLSLGAVTLSATLMTAVVRREERTPFPLLARKALWLGVVLLSLGAVSFSVYALLAPIPGFRPGVSLMVMTPATVITWKLLRREKRG